MRVDCEWCGYGIQCRCRPGHRSTFADFDPEEDRLEAEARDEAAYQRYLEEEAQIAAEAMREDE